MLEATGHRHDGDVDIKKAMTADQGVHDDHQIAALFGDSMFHPGIDEEDGLEKIDEQAEFGDDSPEKIEEELKNE